MCPFFTLPLQTPVNPHVSGEEVGKAEYQRWCTVSWEMKEISPLCLVRHLGLKSANYPPHQCNVFCLSERSSWAFIWATAPEEAPAEPQGCSWHPPSWRTSWSGQTGFVTWAEHHSAFLESFIQGRTSYKPSANRDSSCRDLDPNRCSFASKDSFALKTGNCTRGRESFSPVKQSWRGSCCSLRGKIFLDCESRQSLLFCRPKAFFFPSVRCCYHLQSHIKTVFVLRFDFPHTENSKSTGLFEREKEREHFRCSVCVCLPMSVSWVTGD